MYFAIIIILSINAVKSQDCNSAQLSLAGNGTCQTALLSVAMSDIISLAGDSDNDLCMELCYSLINDVTTYCPDFAIAGLVLQLVCDGDNSSCLSAIAQIEANPECAAQIESMSAAACTGACRDLVNNVATYCAGLAGAITEDDVNRVCGAEGIKHLGLPAILLVTIITLIMLTH